MKSSAQSGGASKLSLKVAFREVEVSNSDLVFLVFFSRKKRERARKLKKILVHGTPGGTDRGLPAGVPGILLYKNHPAVQWVSKTSPSSHETRLSGIRLQTSLSTACWTAMWHPLGSHMTGEFCWRDALRHAKQAQL